MTIAEPPSWREVDLDYVQRNHLCVGPEYVSEFFGSNIFGVGSDEVVYFTGKGGVGNHNYEDDVLDYLDKRQAAVLDEIADDYMEIYND